MDTNWKQAADLLKAGKVGVIPTDTIYGLVASALNERAVERVYSLKGRDFTKPCIILFSNLKDLGQFNLDPTKVTTAQDYWPGPFSIILPLPRPGLGKWEYLHRGKASLAFRNPKHSELQKLLERTGPLIAPSANPEGKKPAYNVQSARSYFGETVDFYVDGGELLGRPSRIISLLDDKPKQLR